jgi:pilus assembly protein CpaB
MATPQRRPALFAAASVILAGIAGLGTYVWLDQVESGLREEIQGANRMRSVVVVTEDLPAGTVIASKSIRLASLPTDLIPDGSFEDPARVVDRIAVMPFYRNEPVLEAKLAPVEVTRGGIAALTGPDKRALAVRVDEVVAVAGFIRPGDRVDVLATLHPDEQSGPVSKIILENVPVLATEGTAADASKNAPSVTAEGPRVMTLEVSPREAEKLSLAASEGRIQLALRHPLNRETAETEGATVEGLLGRRRGANQPKSDGPGARKDGQAGSEDAARIAANTPAGPSSRRHQALPPVVRVEVIRGLERSEVRFAKTPSGESVDGPIH